MEDIGGYRIQRQIARGDFATVYEVSKDGERLALKLAHQEHVGKGKKEADLLESLKNPDIIKVLDRGDY